MAMNRKFGALIVAAALAVPALAAAEQPSALCDGDKMEEKAPTAEKSDNKDVNKAKKSDDKSDKKADEKDSNKS